MSVQSHRVTLFWLSCDGCGWTQGAADSFLSDTLAVQYAIEHGWSTDGDRHHCRDCPELMEPCS